MSEENNVEVISATGATVLIFAVILFLWNVILGLGQINQREDGIYCMKTQTFFGPIKTLCSTSEKELQQFDSAKSNPINRIPFILTAMADNRMDIGDEVYKAFMGPNTWIEKESMFGEETKKSETVEQPERATKEEIEAYNKYDSCQLGDLIVDNIETVKYDGFEVYYDKDSFNEEQIVQWIKLCKFDGADTQERMDCCIRRAMYPEPMLY